MVDFRCHENLEGQIEGAEASMNLPVVHCGNCGADHAKGAAARFWALAACPRFPRVSSAEGAVEAVQARAETILNFACPVVAVGEALATAAQMQGHMLQAVRRLALRL